MNDKLVETIDRAKNLTVLETRLAVLAQLTNYIKSKLDSHSPLELNFICTHNSRRSQFSQIWAQVAASYYNVPVQTFSGGIEVTAFNERAVASCQRLGFEIEKISHGTNPEYQLKIKEDLSLKLFSKLYDHPGSPKNEFAAVMTCSDADEKCPIIPGAEKRIPLRYQDPKVFDNTDLEAKMYDQRSLQIASEMFYVFSRCKA